MADMNDFGGIGTCDNCGALLRTRDLLGGLCPLCAANRGGLTPIMKRGQLRD